MKALLVDVEKREIQEVDLSTDPRVSLQQMYELVGCECLDHFRIPATADLCMVSDDGHIAGTFPKRGWLVEGYAWPLVGNGIVVGVDAYGESVEPRISPATLAEQVLWGIVPAAQSYTLLPASD